MVPRLAAWWWCLRAPVRAPADDYKTSLALVPATRQNDWCIFSELPKAVDAVSSPRKAKGAKSKLPAELSKTRITAPVRRLLINCGAPGDRADGAGNFWLAYPRPKAIGPEGGGGMSRPTPYDPGITMTAQAAPFAPSSTTRISRRLPEPTSRGSTRAV